MAVILRRFAAPVLPFPFPPHRLLLSVCVSLSLSLSVPVFVSLRACDRLFIRVFFLLQLNMKKGRKDKGQLRIDKKSSGSSNNRRNKKVKRRVRPCKRGKEKKKGS